jgi:hypothetical protein
MPVKRIVINIQTDEISANEIQGQQIIHSPQHTAGEMIYGPAEKSTRGPRWLSWLHILNVMVICVSEDDSETRLFWKTINTRSFFLNASGWPNSFSSSYTVIVIISKLASYTRRHVNSIGSERSLNDTTSLSSMFSLQKMYHEREAHSWLLHPLLGWRCPIVRLHTLERIILVPSRWHDQTLGLPIYYMGCIL